MFQADQIVKFRVGEIVVMPEHMNCGILAIVREVLFGNLSGCYVVSPLKQFGNISSFVMLYDEIQKVAA